MNNISQHKAYQYAKDVVDNQINAPKYVIKQCYLFLEIADDKNDKYKIDTNKVEMIDNLMKLLIMPKGLQAHKPMYECLAGFQWLFFIAVLCTVYRDNPEKRRYENCILEICRKNGKTILVGIMFILLFFLEPKFSKFYSVAPDGSLSREVKTAITEIIGSSPIIQNRFKIRRDDILCQLTQNDYVPLNYSTSRLDGKLANAFLCDECGALPTPYALEAMRSGQLTVLNKLGCVISTKYPKFNNPFEDEVSHCKKVLDNESDDETTFSLLYEPDDIVNWTTNDSILEQGNPLALVVPEIMEDLKKKRQLAIEMEGKRENFITKHCNIIYSGMGVESYVDIKDVRQCRVDKIDWTGRSIYIGIDFSQSGDNTAVTMLSWDVNTKTILCKSWAFIPKDKVEEKSRIERCNYKAFIEDKVCFPCGGRMVEYKVLEDFVMSIKDTYQVNVVAILYDRWNALSSAQKFEAAGYETIEVVQHSKFLYAPTKLLKESILQGTFQYETNELFEINFENAKTVLDNNLNFYLNKKKSSGKIDMIAATVDALYYLQQKELLVDQNKCTFQIV